MLLFPPPRSEVPAATGGSVLRKAPADAVGENGAILGVDNSSRFIRVPNGDRYAGIFAAGDPGTGKTRCQLSIVADDLVRFTEHPGALAGIFIDTKGEISERLTAIARRRGLADRVGVFDVSSIDGPQLEIFDRSRPERSAELFVDALRYALPEGDIRANSADVLRVSSTLAMLLPPEVTADLGYGRTPNIVRLCYDLLDPTPTTGRRQRLLTAISRMRDQSRPAGSGDFDSDTRGSVVALDDVFGNAWARYCFFMDSKSRSSADTAPALNKLNALIQGVPGLFETSRAVGDQRVDRWRCSFDDILQKKHFVVISFGRTERLTEDVRLTASSILLWALWDSIKRVCNDWQNQGKSVALYCDELWTIAGGHSSHAHPVIAEMFDGGRSFGVWLAFATQRLSQLPPPVQVAVRSFATKVYFHLTDAESAELAASSIVSKADVSEMATQIRALSLQSGEAITQVTVGGRPSTPFGIRVRNDDEIFSVADEPQDARA